MNGSSGRRQRSRLAGQRSACATFATLAVSMLLSGCSGTSSSPNTVTPVVSSISVTPTNASMNVGSTTQFAASAAYSDGSNKDVTSSASWSSTDSTVASVESTGQASPGLATGVAPGNVNITGSFDGFSSVTVLNVVGTGNLAA